MIAMMTMAEVRREDVKEDVKGWAELGHPQFYSDEQALLPVLNTRPPPPYIPTYVQIYTQVPLSITRGMR